MTASGQRLAASVLVVLAACGGDPAPAAGSAAHSGSIAITKDGARLYVVNADSDSVSIVDTGSRALVSEIALGSTPAVDAAGAYTPAVMPRALALSPDERTLFVTGERSGKLYAIDVAEQAVTSSVVVGSEPIGVVVTGDSAYVACSNDGKVVQVDTAGMRVVASADVGGEPWALAFGDGALLATLFQGPGVVELDPDRLGVRATWMIPDTQPRGDARLAHGAVRGLYDLAARPGSGEIWVAHAMLGIDTPQPELDFERTAFPSLTIFHGDAYEVTLSTDAQDVPGIDGSFADIVSGPHALAFTNDGALALVVDSNSEDVLAVDAEGRVEAALGRPLPGHMPEGIALSPDGTLAYIDERNTSDIAIVAIARSQDGVSLSADGAIARVAADPMPPALRLGQHLFYSANSDELPITKNHWVACATCHMEGRSDAVTWLFGQGPRDTPTNAGGMLGTGFLFRTADRNRVQDYWHTVNIEQGGTFDPVADADLLDAIANYVNLAIPLPVPPTTDPALVARGQQIFTSAEVGCSSCHSGAHFTDSGDGNPALDLGGMINLHDVGTCVTAGFPDVAHDDVAGHPRQACMFDTPSLAGVASTPPYLHDGSARTLRDVLEQTRGKMGDISSLDEDDLRALVEYLRSL